MTDLQLSKKHGIKKLKKFISVCIADYLDVTNEYGSDLGEYETREDLIKHAQKWAGAIANQIEDQNWHVVFDEVRREFLDDAYGKS